MPADRRESNNQGLLTEFGLSERAEQVWLALLATPNASIEEISAATTCAVSQVTIALGELAEVGLARPDVPRSGFSVHEPTIAIETLIARSERELADRRERLGAIRANVPDLAEIYANARAATQPAVDLDVVHAIGEIRERILLASESTRSEHRHLMRDVRPETTRAALDADAASLGRGVAQRSIVGTEDLADPDVFSALASLHQLGEEIRSVPHVPSQMMIMDRDLAVIPRISSDPSLGAIFIREATLVDLLVFLFDLMWSVATPIFTEVDCPGALTERTARVLQLMAAGIKDERIARTLGVGARTVRREIADLKDRLGVGTRTEIVAAAMRQGWL